MRLRSLADLSVLRPAAPPAPPRPVRRPRPPAPPPVTGFIRCTDEMPPLGIPVKACAGYDARAYELPFPIMLVKGGRWIHQKEGSAIEAVITGWKPWGDEQ